MQVSITGEDGKEVATHPSMFELTPQHPALLNRTSTFQLLMSQECVLRGNRVKVHVEPAVGSGRGEQDLQREQSTDPWHILSEEKATIAQENCAFFVRARFSHFSEGCLAKNVLLDNAVQTETAKIGRPRKKQLEFINATRKTLTFLVLPTKWSNKAIKSLAIGVGAAEIGEVKASIEQAIKQAVLTEATEPQVLEIPPIYRQGNPKGGERCTWDICGLPASGGSDARVALVTVENATVRVVLSDRQGEGTLDGALRSILSALG